MSMREMREFKKYNYQRFGFPFQRPVVDPNSGMVAHIIAVFCKELVRAHVFRQQKPKQPHIRLQKKVEAHAEYHSKV